MPSSFACVTPENRFWCDRCPQDDCCVSIMHARSVGPSAKWCFECNTPHTRVNFVVGLGCAGREASALLIQPSRPRVGVGRVGVLQRCSSQQQSLCVTVPQLLHFMFCKSMLQQASSNLSAGQPPFNNSQFEDRGWEAADKQPGCPCHRSCGAHHNQVLHTL